MLARLRALPDRLLGTLWFVPGAIVLAAVVGGVLMVELSARVDQEALARYPRLFGASAGSSRALLAAIAGAMITVAGVTFSITMVAVTQASTQYTPRILRNFMRDRASQVVLGVFVGIFAYCLVVVRTIRDVDELRFVPSLAVLLGLALAIAGTGVLIFFIHHMASLLQATSIVERVARDTVATVDRLFPDEVGDEAAPGERATVLADQGAVAWVPVPSPATGYVQRVDGAGLVRLAAEHDVVVRMARGVGDFAAEGAPLAWVAPGHAAARTAAHASAGVAPLFAIASFRTVEQDAAFGVRQLVDVALKALSPGVNDTTTAVTCVDYLGAVLAHAGSRRIESPYRADGGVVRVIACGPTFESLLRTAVDEIRQSAGGNVSVLARLLETLGEVAARTRPAERRRLIDEQVSLVAEAAERTVPAPYDRERLRALVAGARKAAGAGPG